MKKSNSISALELKRLMHELMESRPDICVRFRLMGAMWHPNYLKILNVTEQGVSLYDEVARQPIVVHDLNAIMQFELDHAFQQYQPYFHYDLEPAVLT